MERRHHIATDHGPMVQGGLLMTHPEGDHGDGEALNVNPPSGRVPGQLLLAIPRSESLRRRKSGRNRVTGLLSRVFRGRRIYRRKGTLRGGPPGPGGQRARSTSWPRQAAAWLGGGPPQGPLLAPGLFCLAYLYMIFLEFSEHFYF